MNYVFLWLQIINCGLTKSVTELPSAMIKIKFIALNILLQLLFYEIEESYHTITRDKSFIIPFSLTQETSKCTLLMPQVFTQVRIKALLTLIRFTNMGWILFSVWYHERASMTTLSVLRYNWRSKLRKIIPTSRPRPCLLHWVACLNRYRLEGIPYLCSCRYNFSAFRFVNKYGLPVYYTFKRKWCSWFFLSIYKKITRYWFNSM